MADFVNKKELYGYIQKEKAWEQSRTRLPRYERGLPDICYDMLDKLNEFYAKQLACTVPKCILRQTCNRNVVQKIDEVEDETQNN